MGVVRFVPLITPKIQAPFDIVEKVVRSTFSFRQKYCRRGLETLFPVSLRERQTERLLQLADVDGTLRPFEVSIEEFDRICQAYVHILKDFPAIERYNPRSEGGFHEELFSFQSVSG